MLRHNATWIVVCYVLPNNDANFVSLPKHPIHQHPQPEQLVVVDADEDHAIVGQQLLGQLQASVHELQPQRMAEAVGLVDEAVVVDEVAVAGVVRRVDVDAADGALVGHAQGAQGVVIVALDDQVAPRRIAMAQAGIQCQRDVVVVERGVGLDLVALPHQPQLALGIAALQQADQRIALQMVVLGAHDWDPLFRPVADRPAGRDRHLTAGAGMPGAGTIFPCPGVVRPVPRSAPVPSGGALRSAG